MSSYIVFYIVMKITQILHNYCYCNAKDLVKIVSFLQIFQVKTLW